jgi:hypothetical protein
MRGSIFKCLTAQRNGPLADARGCIAVTLDSEPSHCSPAREQGDRSRPACAFAFGFNNRHNEALNICFAGCSPAFMHSV